MRAEVYTCDACGKFAVVSASNRIAPEGWREVGLRWDREPEEQPESCGTVCSKECARKWLDDLWNSNEE